MCRNPPLAEDLAQQTFLKVHRARETYATGAPVEAWVFTIARRTFIDEWRKRARSREGLSDDGELTGRGNPVFRGIVTGLMTFIGGFLHTLPFLIPDVHTALLWAYAVVGVELVIIALIRHRYFGTSFALSCLQVIVGGGLVFASGVLIGRS